MTRAVWNGAVIAESDDTIVVGGYTYFRREDVANAYLVESDHTSVCSWKGTASYFSLAVNGKTNKDAAWYYPHPKPGAVEIRERVGFWRGVKIQDSTNAGETDAPRTRWWRRDKREVAREPATAENSDYLDTKRNKLGHLLAS